MVVLGEHREAVQHQHPQSVRITTTIFSENGVSVVAMCADSHLTKRAKQWRIAGCGWVPRRVVVGLPIESRPPLQVEIDG